MKRIVALFLLTMFVVLTLSAQTNDWLWVKKAGGAEQDRGESIAVDEEGNSYVTGYFEGTSAFGSTTLTSSGKEDIFVAKMDPNGNWLWANSAGGSSYDRGESIAVDEEGNSYVTGYFHDIATFGTTTLTSSGEDDIFITKLDTDGNWLWAKKAGGSDRDNGQSIAADTYGNGYVTGYFRGEATFGTTTLTSNGGRDIFIAKMDPNGNWLWAKKAGGSSSDGGYGIAVDEAGNSYVTGNFYQSATFGSTSLKSSGDSDIFIAKMGVNGNWLWAKKAGGSSSDDGYGIAVDSAGNSYMIGYFLDTATFGNTTLTSNGNYDIFIAKIDKNGNWLWANQVGGPSFDYGGSIAVDAEGNSYVTGNFYQSATLGSATLTSSGGYDIFIAKIDTNGIWLWAKQAGGSSSDYGDGIAVDSAGNNYVIGRFYGTATFGNTTMTSSGYSDIFIAKLREPVCFVTPNGGEGWFWPSVQVIQWLTYGQYDVNIKLSIDNGATWTILNEEPVSSTVGEYFFTVPYVISNQCLIRVESADGSRYITSNSCFSIGKLINPNLSVNLNDRTKFRRKESCEIGWEAEGIDYINIEYLLEGTWQNIASSVPVSEGSYFWSVPEVSFDDKCLIRVSDTYNPESIAFSDPFIVCKLDLISPNGEEFWCSQTEQTISWASENIDEIKLEYTIDDGDNWDLIADNISASIGFFQWEVPSTNSHLCRVKITDISEEEISSTSESPFTISPQIILNNLNEEEVLLVNTVFIISWSSCSDVTSVLIDYSIDGGENWLPIQTTPYPATVGLYYWLVPNTPSENCLLKVIRSDNSEVYSISELPFSIVTELKPPVVDFTSDITSGYEPLEIQFTDLSLPMTGKLKSWLWEFGNGDESEEQHPVYVYEDPGIYSVTLTVTSSIDSTATLTFNDYIEILARYAEIEIEYEDMIFPSTYLGANSYPLSILIKNNGNKGLDITQFMFLNDESDFFVEALELPVIIPVEDSLSVDICFSPRSAGRLIDTLFIHNNSVNTPIYSIELRGDGEYVPPKRPTNVQAIDSGDDMVISWDEVTETIFDTPIEPDAYLVFYNGSENPDSEYYFHGDTTETEYVHRNVGKYARHMFYKVYAYKYYGEARASLASFGLKRDMSVSEVKEILRKADYGLLGVQELKTNTK